MAQPKQSSLEFEDIEQSISAPAVRPEPVASTVLDAPRIDYLSTENFQQELSKPPAFEIVSEGRQMTPLGAMWQLTNYPPQGTVAYEFGKRLGDINARMGAGGKDLINAFHPDRLTGYVDDIASKLFMVAGEVMHPDTDQGKWLFNLSDEYADMAQRQFKLAKAHEIGASIPDAPPATENWQQINQGVVDGLKFAVAILGGGQAAGLAKAAGAEVGMQGATALGFMTAIEKPDDTEAIVKNMALGFTLSYGIDSASGVAKKFYAKAKPALKKAATRLKEEAHFVLRKAGGENIVRASAAEKQKIMAALQRSAGRNIEEMQIALKKAGQTIRNAAVFKGTDINQAVPGMIKAGYYKVPEIGPIFTGKNIGIRTAAKKVIEYQSNLARARTFRVTMEAQKFRKHIPDEQVAQDISFYIQKTGNPYIEGDTYAKMAQRLGPRQKVVARNISKIFERERQHVNQIFKQAGETTDDYIAYLENYLPQEWVGKGRSISEWARTYARSSRNAIQRKIPTYEEGIKAGFLPRTLDPIKLLQRWVNYNYGVAGNVQLYNTIKNLELSTQGMKIPAVVNSTQLAKLPKGIRELYGRIESPLFSVPSRQIVVGGKTQTFIKGDLYAHPEVSKLLELIIPYRYPRGGTGSAWRAYDIFNSWAKGTTLRLSFFHPHALFESMQALRASGKNPLGGLVMSPSQAKKLGLKWPISPWQAGKALMRKDPALVEEFIMDGLMINTPVEVARGRFIRGLEGLEARTKGVPLLRNATKGLRQFNEWADKHLWDNLHKGGKVMAHYDIKSQLLSEYPHIPKEVIGKSTARMVNNAMGGLNWVEMGFSPKAQMTWRRILLAPDWTLSNILVAADPLIHIKDPTFAEIGKTYWRNMLASMLVWTEGLNISLTGKSSFENEVGHRWDVDVTSIVQGIKKTLGSDANPNKRYYVSGFKQVKEVARLLGAVGKAAMGRPEKIWTDYIGTKIAPAPQLVLEQLIGYTATGYPMEWKEYESLGFQTIGPRIKNLGSKFVPISLRGSNFLFTFPLREGMSFYKAKNAFAQLAKVDTDDSFFGKAKKEAWYQGSVDKAVEDIANAALANGIDWQKAMTAGRNELTQYYRGKAYEYILLMDKAAKTNNKRAMNKYDKEYVKNMEMSLKASGFYNTKFNVSESIKQFHDSMETRRKRVLGIP